MNSSRSQSTARAASAPAPARERRPVVLVVDDEAAITLSLRSFLTLETDYEVHTFESPLSALAALPRLRPDLVISDFLMPELDGLSFLARVREIDPEIPLVLLTGYADKENAIRAINEIGLYHYVEKPWDNEALRLIIQNGLRQQSLARALRQKIHELDQVLTRLSSLEARDHFLRGELEMARRIQESILPAAPPALPGLAIESHYLPLLEVGGDFFDSHAAKDGRLELLIADVVGHGIQAALITSMVKTVFKECAASGLAPAATLDHLNDRLRELLPAGRFVTAVAASIDVPRRRIAVANAGHPRPYLLRRREQRVEQLPGGALPLAILAATTLPYENVELTVEPGDSLLLYTDGLTDLASADGELFGDRAFLAVLERAVAPPDGGGPAAPAGGRLGSLVLEEARHFAGGQAPADDINIIALDFEG